MEDECNSWCSGSMKQHRADLCLVFMEKYETLGERERKMEELTVGIKKRQVTEF